MRIGVTILCGAALLASCASATGSEDSEFPSLRDVPATSIANTDATYWAAVEAEMLAAGAAVRSNPRAQPVTAEEDPALFLEQAREELERARQAHEPN